MDSRRSNEAWASKTWQYDDNDVVDDEEKEEEEEDGNDDVDEAL